MSDRKLRFSAQAASSYRLWCLSAEDFLHQFMRFGVGIVAFNLLNAGPCVVWNSGERFVNRFFATVVLRNRAHVQHTPGSLSHVEFESGSTECDSQNKPWISPSASTRIDSAAGTRGRPGIVLIAPQMATTKPAPADSRTSRTDTMCPVGAPSSAGSVEKLYCVLAIQTGRCP